MLLLTAAGTSLAPADLHAAETVKVRLTCQRDLHDMQCISMWSSQRVKHGMLSQRSYLGAGAVFGRKATCPVVTCEHCR